jgi:HTH-type transcriptional regulator / antitoxin HigA
MTTYVPTEAFPPGDLIREELESRRWSQSDFAEILGKSEAFVSEIIVGRRGITTETAQALADAFGTSAQWWLNMESAYRLALSRTDTSAVAKRARLYAVAPVRDMVKRGWIEPSLNPDTLEESVKAFLGVGSLDEMPMILHAARKSAPYAETAPALTAWLVRVAQLAPSVQAAPYTAKHFDALIKQLRPLMSDVEEIRNVPATLAAGGVRLLVVEPLPRTKVDGACLWLGPHEPVVVVSMRYDRVDGFWHTLLHELAHVKQGAGRDDAPPVDVNLIGAQQSADRPAIEVEADEYAANAIIPTDDLDGFIARVSPLYSKVKIRGFAAVQGVHPGLVVGQLQHRGEIDWSHSRDMLEKVRDIITQSALTDGWGHQHSVAD